MKERYVIGADEAGRGPVIGPLVLCAFACSESDERELRKCGVKDSKMLTPEQRERFAVRLKGFPHEVISVPATELNELMGKRVSLNEIEARKVALLLERLVARLEEKNVARAFIDSPDPNPKKFGQRIRKYYDARIELVCENKADANYAVVGAASILAKVLRDKEIEEIKRLLGVEFGNGYSHDELTIEFLKKNWRDPRMQEFVRQKWATAKRLKTTQMDLQKFL